MYTNIGTNHALGTISQWLDSIPLPKVFPLAAVKVAMELLGTAMGTSAACMWATIYLTVHEMSSLVPKFNTNLLLLLRFIDDIIGIWIGNPLDQDWEYLKKERN